jgi:hypothetical protein
VIAQGVLEAAEGESASGEHLRRSRRFKCAGVAEVYAEEPGILFRGEILDISQTGCYIGSHARMRLERFIEVDLLFILNNHNYRAIARVMNLKPGEGVGLEFQFENPRTEESFKKLIQTISSAAPSREAVAAMPD